MIQLQASNRFYYRPGDRTIEVQPIRAREDLFALLHEWGHAACGHVVRESGLVDGQDVRRECEAWAYALRCVRPERQAEAAEYALRCVATYNDSASINYGEYFSRRELMTMMEVDHDAL